MMVVVGTTKPHFMGNSWRNQNIDSGFKKILKGECVCLLKGASGKRDGRSRSEGFYFGSTETKTKTSFQSELDKEQTCI